MLSVLAASVSLLPIQDAASVRSRGKLKLIGEADNTPFTRFDHLLLNVHPYNYGVTEFAAIRSLTGPPQLGCMSTLNETKLFLFLFRPDNEIQLVILSRWVSI